MVTGVTGVMAHKAPKKMLRVMVDAKTEAFSRNCLILPPTCSQHLDTSSCGILGAMIAVALSDMCFCVRGARDSQPIDGS